MDSATAVAATCLEAVIVTIINTETVNIQQSCVQEEKNEKDAADIDTKVF